MNKQHATKKKRDDLRAVITRFLEPEISVRGVVAVGSIATGSALESSDIDAVIFMNPIDRYILTLLFMIWMNGTKSGRDLNIIDSKAEG